jgi:ribosomal subunit interface protein
MNFNKNRVFDQQDCLVVLVGKKVETPKNQMAEVNAHVLHGTILNATATTPDLYKSIDEIAHKMEIQLEKYKGLHFNHHEEVPLKMQE